MRLLATTSILIIAVTIASAQDWPNWRGPNHDGLSTEKGFETHWGETTPPKLWDREIGSGFSGMSCVDGKLYTCGTADKQQVMICLNADTGAVIWRKPFEPHYPDGQGGDGPRATPAVHGGRVYVQGGFGRVVCFDARTGKELWSRRFSEKPVWGYSASVLIDGQLAIVTGDNALVALDKDTGKPVWACPGGMVGYATPYPFTLDDRRYVVGFMAKEALIVDIRTGKKVWSLPWETSWDVNAATPIFHDGHLFLSSGYRHGSIMLALRHQGGALQAKEVWQNRNIRAKFQSPVLYGGHLYTSDEVGLKCVELATGESKEWKRRRVKHGTLVIADGHAVILTEDGQLLIAPAKPEAFEPQTDTSVRDGRCWTVPTLYKGRLYVRNLEHLACYNLTRK